MISSERGRRTAGVTVRVSRRMVFAATAVMVTVAVGATVTRVARADDGAVTLPTDAVEQGLGWEGNEELWRRETILSELNTFIVEFPGIQESGYVTQLNAPFPMSTTLMWHGPANPAQQAITTKARQLGIIVTVVPRRYGRDDLDRAAKALEGRSGRGIFANFEIFSWGEIPDFDGVVVEGRYLRPLTVTRAVADAELARAATAEFGVAVDIRPGGRIVPA